MITGAPRIGRDGRLSLTFERRGERSVVTRCGYTLPLQVLAPIALDDDAAIVSVLTPTGGLVGGDVLTIDVNVTTGAHACLTTPSATKVYRTAAGPALQRISFRLASGAQLEWVPDHTISFAGSVLCQTLEADVGDDAVLVMVDAFAAGRVARGEAWRFALLDSTLSVRDQRGWLLHDRFVLRDGEPRGFGITEGRPYFATIVVVADAGIAAFAEAVAAVEGDADIGVGVLPRRGAVVRCLAYDAPTLGAAIDSLWGAARREVLKLPPLALRKG